MKFLAFAAWLLATFPLWLGFLIIKDGSSASMAEKAPFFVFEFIMAAFLVGGGIAILAEYHR